MYEFCDTTETPKVNPLPAEAVCFNGVWLDSEVPGFRTLSVEGREFVARSIDTYTVGNTDGAYYRGASFGGRTITVEYQLIEKDQYTFREAYNKLNSLLRATQCQLIFADEPDKYFIATRSSNGSIPTGRNGVTGTIVFFCADPKKYAIKEKEMEASAQSGEVVLSIRNDGNEAVPVTYEIVCESDNGYVGIENGENYIRFGSEAEADGEDVEVSEILLGFRDLVNASDDAPEGITNGSLQTVTVDGREWFGHLSNVGTGSSWHGQKRTLVVPPDKNGNVGAVNFTCYSFHWFQCAFVTEMTRQTIQLYDKDDNCVIMFQISKDNKLNASSYVIHWVNGQTKNTFNFECGADPNKNPFFNNRGHNSIDKIGGTIRMFWFGKYYNYYDPELVNVAITKIRVFTYAYGDSPQLVRNYIGDFVFQKNNVSDWNNIANRYAAGDDIVVNGEEGKMYVNGISKIGDEIKGSEYFLVEPGINSVSVHCSSWATGINVKARIREAWI